MLSSYVCVSLCACLSVSISVCVCLCVCVSVCLSVSALVSVSVALLVASLDAADYLYSAFIALYVCREELQHEHAQLQHACDLQQQFQAWTKRLAWSAYTRTASMTQNGQPVLLDQLRVYIASDQQRNAANLLLTEFLTKAQEQHCPWDGLACIRCESHCKYTIRLDSFFCAAILAASPLT